MGPIYALDFKEHIINAAIDFLLENDDSAHNDLSSYIIVFPGKRPQFYLKKGLSERIKKPFLPPQVFSIESFIESLGIKLQDTRDFWQPCQKLSLLDACFAVYNIIQRTQLEYFSWQRNLDFEHFFSWAKKTFKFLEELDKELISSGNYLIYRKMLTLVCLCLRGSTYY